MREAPDAATPRPLRLRLLGALGGVLGFSMLLAAAVWVGFAKAGLATVLTTRPEVVSETTAPGGSWVPLVLCTVLGLVLTTGRLPRGGRIDLVQVGAATWTLVWLAICTWLGTGWELTDQDVRCSYRSCWPQHYQEAALAAPLLVACTLMYVMATLGRRRPWWPRALVPSLAFLVLSIVQVAIWDRFAVPTFASPPPF